MISRRVGHREYSCETPLVNDLSLVKNGVINVTQNITKECLFWLMFITPGAPAETQKTKTQNTHAGRVGPPKNPSPLFPFP